NSQRKSMFLKQWSCGTVIEEESKRVP
ncbi:hypothetical protein HKBW3S03_01878, partial [Candidatus Hakubella thermalkaliphila]